MNKPEDIYQTKEWADRYQNLLLAGKSPSQYLSSSTKIANYADWYGMWVHTDPYIQELLWQDPILCHQSPVPCYQLIYGKQEVECIFLNKDTGEVTITKHKYGRCPHKMRRQDGR